MAPVLSRRAAPDRAFERMYRRHVGDVYRYTLAVLRNRDDAEDVTQTTFMNAYRAYQRGERPEQAKNWLIAIAHNVCRQRFRQAQRRPQETMLFPESAELAVEEPEHEYSADDIQRALGHLAFNQRAALVMRELEGRSYAEIAQIMGVTVSAVETLIFRGRRALREQLEGSLTCSQAELALSKQADGMLPRSERGQLRAHLRECKECASFARRQRATRSALRALGAVPLPSSLLGWFGGGGATVGAGVAAKAAAVVCAGVVVGGVGYEGSRHVDASRAAPRPTVAAVKHARPHVRAPRPVVPATQVLLPLERVAPQAVPKPEPKAKGLKRKPKPKAPARGSSAVAHARNDVRKAAKEEEKAAETAARELRQATKKAAPKVHGPKPKVAKAPKVEAAKVPPGQAKGRAKARGQGALPPGQAKKQARTKP
jgi:RNA polymerase sigma-70 factor (ECF subfamily)